MKLLDALVLLLTAVSAIGGALCFGNTCWNGNFYAMVLLLALMLGAFTAISIEAEAAQKQSEAHDFPSAVRLARLIVASRSALLGACLPLKSPADWRVYQRTRSVNRIGVLVEPTVAWIVLASAASVFLIFFAQPVNRTLGIHTEILRGGRLNCAISLGASSVLAWGSFALIVLSYRVKRSQK